MPNKKNKPLRVVELFAGVGGFRLGLEGYNGKSASSNYKNSFSNDFRVIWSNQWEPSTNRQHANEVYLARWPEEECNYEHSQKNIEDEVDSVPEHDVLVGGFPCQDYSVATTLKNSKGLIGVKGVLWWSIYSILKKQGKKKPKYLILENVDRLLVSPASQRGRDFAVMLSCLNELGYMVDWRVINAADYGMPQRRRRTFIIGYLKDTPIAKFFKKVNNVGEWLTSKSIISSEFKIDKSKSGLMMNFEIKGSPKRTSNGFNKGEKFSPFLNTGMMKDGVVHTLRTYPIKPKKRTTLEEVLVKEEKDIDDEFYIDPKTPTKETIIRKQIDADDITVKTQLEMWEYLKGKKKEPRKSKTGGYTYKFAEGKMTFPDALDKPSRTIITGEGGASPSRFKHVIKDEKGRYRRLTPVELERLNMFPDNHTEEGTSGIITNSKRAFFMGNALVVGVVEKLGKSIINYIK